MSDPASVDDSGFWRKVKEFAVVAGREVLEKALVLYYVMTDPETPTVARAQIAAALGYFIAPIDAIPDLTPLVGFGDDLGALALTLTLVAASIKPVHQERARAQVDALLGPAT